MNKYIKRLYEEWTQHGKIIVAVDYDDTIKNWKMNDFETYDKVLDLVRKVKETGAYIVIFSACEKDRYPEITKFCESHGIQIDSINQNPINLPYGNQNKIYANIFLDDRAGLEESIQILETTMYMIRGDKNTENTMNQKF